jgi:HEAT repeat protein
VGQDGINDTLTDEVRLRSTCAKLAEDSLKSDWVARHQAALTLSYIEDPIAVPFLKRVLKEGEGGSIVDYAVDGLVRIATLEAVDALMDAARTNTSLQNRIRVGLQNVELTTQDGKVKAHIRALER